MLGVGSTMNPVTLHSSDAGASFTTRSAPSAVACTPSATSPEVVWTSCSTGMSTTFQRTGLDGTVSLPVHGGGTANTFLEAVSDDTAYFGTSSGEWAGLRLTRDAGRHFTKVSTGPPGYTGDSTPYMIWFLTAHVALAASPVGLYRTVDGGVSWHPIADPRKLGI